MDVVRKLAELAKRRKFELILIIPPRCSDARQQIEEQYLLKVRQLLRPFGVPVLDCRRLESLSNEHFFDADHLNAQGAAIFSKEVAELLTLLPRWPTM